MHDQHEGPVVPGQLLFWTDPQIYITRGPNLRVCAHRAISLPGIDLLLGEVFRFGETTAPAFNVQLCAVAEIFDDDWTLTEVERIRERVAVSG